MTTIQKLIGFKVILLSILILTGCEDKKQTQTKPQEITSVNVHTIQKQTYPIWVTFSGKTEAFQDVIITPRVVGELKEVLFKDGDIVKKGQTLFKIDDSEYQAVLAQKVATLKKNEASLALAIANLNRYEPLVKKQLAPREKLDELIANKKQLEATVNADKSSIKQAQLNVDYCTIVSPIDGQIGKSLIDIGNIVNSSSKLANIIQSEYLKVNFNPSSNEVSLINKYKSQEKPEVKVIPEKTDNKALQLKGVIDFVDNVTNQTTGTVAMRAKIDNQQKVLFPGTFVEIELFITDQIPIIAVHPNNISQNQLGSYVLVVTTDNKIATRQIVISYSNKDLVIVKEGLKEGDKVIVSATNRLRNNQSVKTVEVANPIKL